MHRDSLSCACTAPKIVYRADFWLGFGLVTDQLYQVNSCKQGFQLRELDSRLCRTRHAELTFFRPLDDVQLQE